MVKGKGLEPLCDALKRLAGERIKTLNNSGEQRNFADGKERRIGRAQRWRSRSRGVMGQASLSAYSSCPLAESLAGGGVGLTRRASTQAKPSPSQRGVESVKLCRELPVSIRLDSLCHDATWQTI